jgi:hypothetical protein
VPVAPPVVDLVPVAEEVHEAAKAKPAPPDRRPAPRDGRKKKAEAAKARERVEDEEAEAAGLLQRRDFLMIALGGVALGLVVLLVAGFVYAVHRLLRPRPEPEPPPPAPDEPAP